MASRSVLRERGIRRVYEGRYDYRGVPIGRTKISIGKWKATRNDYHPVDGRPISVAIYGQTILEVADAIDRHLASGEWVASPQGLRPALAAL